MENAVLIRNVLVAVALASASVNTSAVADDVDMKRIEGIGILMNLEKATYSVGEPISLGYCLFNYSDFPIVLQFATSQRFDFVIHNEQNREVWRWSKGMMFAQRLSERVIGRENREISYNIDFKERLSKGSYKLTGLSMASNYPASATICFEVN